MILERKSGMECYKELAEVYDELINQDIDYKKWCEFILMKCKQLEVDRVDYLDLACGTGNFTVELCEAFKHTWAVDLSSDMLTKAEEKIRKSGMKARFVCQDISNLILNHKFDLISCCLDSTNYILDSEKLKNFFHGVFNLLKDNGLFIFNIN
jgi:ubiquinone/menaquinone biosynthesis C-methylase UbiE